MVYGVSNSHLLSTGAQEQLEDTGSGIRGEPYAPPDLGWNVCEERASSLYGPQDLYQQTTFRVISEISSLIKNSRKDDTSLSLLFQEILQLCARSRRDLAQQSSTFQWELFGVVRKTEGYLITDIHQKSNRTDYKSAYDAITDMVQEELAHMSQQPSSAMDHTTKSRCGGRLFSRTIERFDSQKVQENHWDKNPLGEERNFLAMVDCWGIVGWEKKIDSHFMGCLKKLHPKIYQQHRMHYHINYISEKLNTKADDYILVTPRMQINNKMYALTQILTLVRPAPSNCGMSIAPLCLLVHQDEHLLGDSEKEYTRLFQHAVCWEPQEGIPELKERVALFRYLFAHATPFMRGSAAIGEWIEMGLYSCHDLLAVRVCQSYMSSDLVAFATSLFPEYLVDYNARIEVTPIVYHT